MLLKTNVKAGVKVSLHSRTDFCYFSPREAALIYREELPPTEQMTRESFLVIESLKPIIGPRKPIFSRDFLIDLLNSFRLPSRSFEVS